MAVLAKNRQLSRDPPEAQSQIEMSLLDITFPYHRQSMLAQSTFFGLECLMFEISIYFSFMYIIINFVNKGYLLKWHILEIVSSNLITDIGLILLLMAVGLLWVYLGYQIVLLEAGATHGHTQNIMYTVCIFWTFSFVAFAHYVINHHHFYFTDRIFIIVVSWSLAVKNSSFCLDLVERGREQLRKGWFGLMAVYVKFMMSPMVVFKQFSQNSNPGLKIHISYILIKIAVTFFCLTINYILMTQFLEPFLHPQHANTYFIDLFFQLIPLLFYINFCLYYLIFENILPAMAEITQLNNRQSYRDWWNATTISQFLDKWVVQINAFSNTYMPNISKRCKHAVHLCLIFIMVFSIFGEEMKLKMLVFALFNISIVFFLGSNTSIQNNYIVHILTISFCPFWLAVELKYNIFH